MAPRGSRAASSTAVELNVSDYRHDEKRKNIPPAKIAAEGRVPAVPKINYSYSPRPDPVLRFDPTAKADRLPELLQAARQRALSAEEARILSDALRVQEPWLEWSGKRESKGFGVDPVALHIHERVAAQAVLKIAARQDVTRDLFADPQQDYRAAVQFYQHDIDWTNRLILGDALQVMASLATREDLAGKVQMIYIDPPYGIQFASNFQPTTQRADVKDQPSHLTREVELVRAYRDTWHLGVHSYLSYLRDRLAIARTLLADTGAIFIQIGEDNLHRVRAIVDDLFGSENIVTTILVKKKGSQKGGLLEAVNDYLIFCAKDKERFKKKFHVLTKPLQIDEDLVSTFRLVELSTGETLTLTQLAARLDPDDPARENPVALLSKFPGARLFTSENSTGGRPGSTQALKFEFEGRTFDPGIDKGLGWKHTAIETGRGRSGMARMAEAGRLYVGRDQIRFRRYHDDFGRSEISAWWDGLGGAPDPIYVVQTNTKVIERCMLMTTDPGDLVLDPTCGRGTTAYVAEQWGRRWITIDTSRVAVALARQRLLTAQFDYYALKQPEAGVDAGFQYKTAPHITSSVIARCDELDPIIDKHAGVLEKKLTACSEPLRPYPTTFAKRSASNWPKNGRPREIGRLPRMICADTTCPDHLRASATGLFPSSCMRATPPH
jgi:adenine-specific DNA-methyltransferase